MMKIRQLAILLVLLFSTGTDAAEFRDVFRTWISEAPVKRLQLSLTRTRLENPDGFDLPGDTFDNGYPVDGLGSPDFTAGLNLSFERHVHEDKGLKSLLGLTFDFEEYDGLKVRNFMASYGYAFSSAGRRNYGFRVAAGISGGLTYSDSYFDSAYHLAYEGWVGFLF